MTFGDFIKSRRRDSGQSLRAFAATIGYDPGNYSKLERGVLNPPDDAKAMETLASALGIGKATDDWIEFENLAAIARKQIPKPLLDDAEVVEKLPVLFRTLRGDPLSPDKLNDLIDFMRHRQ